MKKSCIFLLLIICLSACKKDRLHVKVSNAPVNLNIGRLDSGLFNCDTSTLFRTLQNIQTEDREYFDIYTNEILHIGSYGDDHFNEYLGKFVTDTVYRKVADSVLIIFKDLSNIEKQIKGGFNYYRYYFPGRKLPDIITQISGFNQSIVSTDSAIGISLDQYMGPNCVYYQYLGIPSYKRENMYSGKIAADVFYAYAACLFPYNAKSNNLLSNMLYQGKLTYFAKAMLPDTPDSVIIGYSQHHLDWCKANEAQMWTYLAEKKLLFSSDRMAIRRFLGDAPFTNDFTSASPGRTGVWIGWQIINSYMNKNEQITLKELMETDDYQSILNLSGYHPN